MLFDSENLFSDDQAITATAASTNIIDLGTARDMGKGTPIPIRVQVTETFDNLTDLTFQLQVDDNSGFSSATTVQSATVVLANLTAGAVVKEFMFVPRGTNERYVRFNYSVNGTNPTAGKITAGIIMGHQAGYDE